MLGHHQPHKGFKPRQQAVYAGSEQVDLRGYARNVARHFDKVGVNAIYFGANFNQLVKQGFKALNHPGGEFAQAQKGSACQLNGLGQAVHGGQVNVTEQLAKRAHNGINAAFETAEVCLGQRGGQVGGHGLDAVLQAAHQGFNIGHQVF